MRFAYETRRLVNKGPLRRTLSVFLGGDQELKDIVEEAERKRDELIQASDITYDEAYDQMLHAINQKTEEVGETLGHIQLALNRMDQENGETAGNVRAITLEQLRDRQLRDLNAKLESHLKLLQSEGIADIHEPKKVLRESLERRHPGTCEWIVSDPRFSAWFQPECAGSSNVDSLLWLSGAAGFGKSVLMSYVMDYLERQALSTQSKDKPVVLRFFCKLGNDASQKDAKILANLISQLLFLVVELDDVSDSANAEGCCQTKKRCVDLIDEPKPDGTSLGIGTSVSARAALLCDLARAFNRRVYVLIDALDECEDRGEALLGWLVQVAEADLDVRVLVSSRPESDIQRAFAKHNPPGIEVEKEVTERDVEAYIAGTLRTFSRFDQSKRQKAFARIAERAAGMFRYAHLAIESLRSPAALRRSFKELMDGLPDGLAVLYERELCALEPDKREILMVALRWLVCGEGPISLTLVADELEGTYLHDHPDPEAEDDETEGGNEGIEAGDLSNNHDRPEIQRVGDEERDSIEHLRSAGRNFLKIDDQGIMTLQHTSVRDYVISRSENPTGDQQDALSTNDDGRTALDLAGLSWLAGEDTTGIYGLTVDVFLRQDMPVPSALRPVLLTLAAEDGSAEVCRRIVQLDRHLAQVPDGHGWTPWMVAAHARQLAVLRILQDLDAMSDDSSDPEPTSDAQHGYPPSAWISIAEAFESRDKLELRKTNPDRQTVGPVFADHPAPFDVSRYYWELDVVEVMEASIALGLSLEHNRYDILSETWHYRDVAEIPDRRLFPVVVVSGRTVWLKANFGTDPDKPFKYDPELYGAETEEPTGFRQTT
ncbi:6ef63968-6691-420c-b659-3bb6916fd5a4 [Thermothielavioides terrestris]|uniref:6ef63968-6691-420c-b659-3bb6916fd5a4 n=1 Tax=Thermothielavioides terrestris TaxID=2587410 RepID=A0A3S4AKW1_9PEZI|nr:6ef63968-6691-420c-b659-3bb6916fd5a4 [Thermothielavioides terrestris]